MFTPAASGPLRWASAHSLCAHGSFQPQPPGPQKRSRTHDNGKRYFSNTIQREKISFGASRKTGLGGGALARPRSRESGPLVVRSWPTPGPLPAHSWNAPGPPLLRSCLLLVRSLLAPGALCGLIWRAPCPLLMRSWPPPFAFLAHYACKTADTLQSRCHLTPAQCPGCSWPTPLRFCLLLVRSRLTPAPTTWTQKGIPKARE